MRPMIRNAGRWLFAACLAIATPLWAGGPTTQPATTRPATTQPATTQPAATHGGGLLGGPVRHRGDEGAGPGFNGRGGGRADRMGQLQDILATLDLTEAQDKAIHDAVAEQQAAVYVHRRRVAALDTERRSAQNDGDAERAKRLAGELRELRSREPNREGLVGRVLDVLNDEQRFQFVNATIDRDGRDPANRVARALGGVALPDAQRERIDQLTAGYRAEVRRFRRANFDKLMELRRQMARGGKDAKRAREAMGELFKQGPGPAYVRNVAETVDASMRPAFWKSMQSGKPIKADGDPSLDL